MRPVTKNLCIIGLAVALSAAIAPRSAAAAASTSGCMNQWLFNGVWRVQVTKVEPLMDGAQQVGWQVTEVWRNGTMKTLSPSDTMAKSQVLELSNGTKISSDDTTTSTLSNQVVNYHEFPASGQFSYVQSFRSSSTLDPNNKPKSVDIGFDAAKESTHSGWPQYTTKNPDYVIKLDCTASGTAANAMGGSSEVPGKDGCMNQWMSNGIWRVRVTSVGPDMGDGSQQLGWAITEQWTNVSKRAMSPADGLTQDQQLVLTDGNTVSSSNSTVSTLDQQKLVYHTFAPGESFTYAQLFRPTGFVPTDKPVKVIFVFDSAAMQKRTGWPQYTNPPNFRISLTCGS